MSDDTDRPAGISEGGSYIKKSETDAPQLIERTAEAPRPNEAPAAPAPAPKPAQAKPLGPLKTGKE